MPEYIDYLSQMQALRRQFVERTRLEGAHLEEALQRFETGSQSADDVKGLGRMSHRLVGGLSTFGFKEASAEATTFAACVANVASKGLILSTGRVLAGALRSLSC